MKRIPYGQSNFEKVAMQNFYYVDKTRYVETLENLSSQFLVFLRPRRFGKSLFVSMLRHYYDRNRKDGFDVLFGNTYIGQHPTPLRNHYPVLFLTFSGIRTYGTLEETMESFNLSINGRIRTFLFLNKDYLEITEHELNHTLAIKNGADQLRELIEILNVKNKTFYVMIDEYDNFGNNILAEYGKDKYLEVTHGVGFLRNFFAVIKDGTLEGKIDRLFVTGVSPLVLADVTSGFNIGTNISLFPAVSSMLGFTQQEMENIVDYYIEAGSVRPGDRNACIDIMETWYNGYKFSAETPERLYNSDMVLYFMTQYLAYGKIPTDIVDENVRIDYGKLKYVIFLGRQLNGNFYILRDLLEQGELRGELIKSMAVGEEIDPNRFLSLLYFLGLTTIQSADELEMTFVPPNKLIHKMLWDYIRRATEEAYHFRVDLYTLHQHFRNFALKGEWRTLLTYIFEKFYQAASARDFVFHEEGVKMFLLAYLNMAKMYRVESEKALEQGYSDIFMYPDVEMYPEIQYGFIFELKYLKSENINTEKKKQKRTEQTFIDAKKQLEHYAASGLFKRKLKTIAVIVSAKEVLKMEEV